MIDYYSLRFQIEFNFRDAKLMEKYRCQNPEYSVLYLKSHYGGLKYIHEILKILPQKPEPIVI